MRSAALLLSAATLAAQVKLPPYQRKELSNGAVLLTVSKPEVPLATLIAVIRGGTEADPAQHPGLSSITAAMLNRGAGSRSASQFAEDLDQTGASFRAGSDEQSTIVRIEFMSRHADQALDLFASALTAPRFDPAEFKKLVSERLDRATSLKDEAGPANSAYFRTFYFGPNHPYGRVEDELSLKTLRLDDVKGFHTKYYAARNMIFVAAGDVSASLGVAIEKRISAIPAGARHEWIPEPPAPVRKGPRLLLIDKPDATQTYFVIGQPGLHRTHPDRTVMWVVNTLFGGRFTSMLNDELRVNSGLTYGAGSDVQMDRLPGATIIRTFTKTETTVQAIDLALSILKKIRSNGLTAQQLHSAKSYIKGQYPADQLETADQVAAILGDIELHGLNRGEVDDLFSRIDAVTVDQANAAIRKHLREENLQFCLTGAASKIKEQVAKYAPSLRVIPISTPGVRPPEF
ncbi:MAG: insulinase family protein [Acidobacteria bacterium]|nr:insulinase family protein [Acidobacteriota bacterium]